MARLHVRGSLFALAGVAFSALSASGAPTAPSPYDVTTYSVVVTEPGMKDVTVTTGTWGDGLAFEVARPAGTPGVGKRPAVVFVNGVGGKLNEWEIYRSWARLVATHGLAGVLFESKSAGSAAGVSAFFAHLSKNADALGLDASRFAAWSCSANVLAGLPAVMAGEPIAFRAAVFYYGTGDAPALRKDLPVYWVLAGRDGPSLVEGQKALFARAVKEQLPWTMVVAPDLPHAFDAVEPTPHSRAVVRETVAFLEAALAPAAAPDDVPLPKRASAFMYAGEPGNAVAVYREILAKSPDDGEARTLLGLALSRSGKPAEAVVELERALALGTDSASLQQNLGEAYLRSGNPAEAAVHYRKAIERGRKFPPVYFNLARAAALTGNTDEAFACLLTLTETGWAGRAQTESEGDFAALRSDPRWAATLVKFPAPPR
jgi:tetratricopeptide (TPR) repeat protein